MTAEPNNPKNNIVLDSSGYYAKPRTQFERFLDKLKPRSAALRTTVLVTFVVCFSLFMSLWFIWRTLYLPELQQHAGYLAIESEIIHNPNFKPIEFDRFKAESGDNAFTLTPQQWIKATDAIGIVSIQMR